MSEEKKSLEEVFGPVIHSYSRKEALADGVLVDVSNSPAGEVFRFPVAITAQLDAVVNDIPEGSGASREGRLWDVAFMASVAAKSGDGGSRIKFKVILPKPDNSEYTPELYADCGPGDNGEPVITIGYPEDF